MSRTDRMASDLSRTGPVERDIEQAITALKKGACLLKYGRRGKPKFCPFRLSNDESVLIWFLGKEVKHLKLSHVSRIISGQRTPIFQRYPRPEKEYQSFSLIYNERSLDLICKDKDEAEVWFSGLKALISRSHQRKWRTESRSDGISSEANSPKTYTRRSSPLNSPFGSNDSLQKDGGDHLRLHSPYESPPKNGLDKAFSDVILYGVPPKGLFPTDSASGSVHSLSSGGSDSVHGHMKATAMDAFRVSLSSAVSSSSQGSGHDDGDALGDVFIWGEGTGDGVLGGGLNQVGSCGIKMDSLLPKALESAVVLDVQNIACGGRHAALVTKQGEVFSWGGESGGRLGHGVDSDILHPKLIDTLSNTNIELVACGEYHTCAVTLSGDLYTWGDGTYNFGLLGHGNEVSHWVPKRVNGPLEGIHVSSISCGPWHTAVVTSAGQLFTFGDGTFGVLGHGDRNSVSIPREVESLKGFRTVRAACGVWHTAAVVEVMVGNSSSNNCSSGKLFTWGDGDKGRLGHGDKDTKLVPTCVAVEPNICQVACGHSLTVALTTSGYVYTIGSPVYGQLGNPQADGKFPIRVEGKLSKSFIEEISAGAYHVAVLTSRTEVYTWGKGANGRLGHGDADDRNSPTLVEALKDKQVKSIACGTNFTAAICLHKWVSGFDQSMCSGCRLPFNFTRKRHNCYNCGLVFCHACSNKKCLKASMAPNPNKPYRVCDNCFYKLRKAIETEAASQSSVSRRASINHGTSEFVDKDDKLDSRSRAQLARFSSMESLKQGESRSKINKKLEFNSSRVSPVPNGGSQWGALNISKSFNPVFGSSKKFFSASVPGSRIVSRATSPISRRPSPPRSTTPTPTLGGLTSPKIFVDDTKRTNDSLSQEVVRLRAQVENLTRKAHLQEVELERTTKQLKEAIAFAEEETAKCKAAKEVIKSLTAQLKDMAERLPVGATRNIKSPSFTLFGSSPASNDVSSVSIDTLNGQIVCQEPDSNVSSSQLLSNGSNTASNRSLGHNKQGHIEPATKSGGRTKEGESRNENEWVEQDEPGVYITLTWQPGGAKDLKRVRFSRKRFSEKQAERWWVENKARVCEQYNVRMIDKSSVGVGSEDLAH
ncbi:PH, RCC1 and FYVE domains-containing protein 1-like isoform X2 [Durio zibethinus]|uniref:PH, RCC1 and FYVE domains-containing protein 1-like isoform X2 n=1 Tax=Durio zibethinus TaxID=66656 RepID=A0A6P5ZUG0_DURZI|nr:PH, RCC1 and FYVE domains-containing protein 1-like isoform X2 [Durio zibethinus]